MNTSPTIPPATVPPDYHPDLFVDRDDEIRRMVELVSALASGRSLPRRTVVFRGERGCGKTWLLRHLADEAYAPDGRPRGFTGQLLSTRVNGVKAWYLSLASLSDSGPEDGAKAIIVALREQIGQWRGMTPVFRGLGNWSLHELSVLLDGDVRHLLQQHVLVLLLDHVYESRPALLDVLEDRLLAPLAQHTKLAIVMAGRGRGYAWRAPELRLRVDEYWLQGLGVPPASPPLATRQTIAADAQRQRQATEEQLNRLRERGYPIARDPDEILPETLGHPLVNCLLAIGQGPSEVAATLLEGIPPLSQQMLRLVCPLRCFDAPHIGGLLAACGEDSEVRAVAPMSPREIMGGLLQTGLVRYDNPAGAYVMDEVVRKALEEEIKERRVDLWVRLHRAAWEMYCGWMRDYPEAEARLKPEAEYHAARLNQAAIPCPEPLTHEEG